MRRPKRSLGQNFLVDPAIARRIVEASGAASGDALLEIGPGKGALSGLLAPLGEPLVLLEKDDGLVEHLRRKFDADPRVLIVHDDAMTTPLEQLPLPSGSTSRRAVANLPYNVASRIALRFLAWGGIDDATFTFQREVAVRFAATPGNRDYGALSVMARVYADPYLLFPIPPVAFRPVPKVDSHVVRFRLLTAPRVSQTDLPMFERVVRGVFRTRRKTILNSLRHATQLACCDDLLAEAGVDAARRAETLAFEEFEVLAKVVSQALAEDSRES